MFYSLEMVKNLGYETLDDFTDDYIKQHKMSPNIFIDWKSDGVFLSPDFYSQEGCPNIGEVMSEQRRKDAIKYIMACLEDGYIDLGLYDQDELMIVEEAMELLIAVEKFNSIPMVNPVSVEDLKKILERSDNGEENYS